MIAPIYPLARSSSAVMAILGSPNPRFYAFGNAPQPGKPGYALPYAVWQTVYGSPENYVNQRPDVDNWGIQVDAYAASAQQARDVSQALSDALEGQAHVTAWNGEDRETETNLYRVSFTVEFWTPR